MKKISTIKFEIEVEQTYKEFFQNQLASEEHIHIIKNS